MAPSRSAQEYLKGLAERDAKAAFGDPVVFESLLEASRQQDGKPVAVPDFIEDGFEVARFTLDDGHECFRIVPKSGARDDREVIFYHGGGFIMQMSPSHWTFCAALAEAAHCAITVPIYPLAPNHRFDESYRCAWTAFETTRAQHPDSRLVVIGDSAGANLAIGMAQLALEAGADEPSLIVAISPWLDMVFELPGREELEPNDPLLRLYGLKIVAEHWAGDAPTFPPNCLHGPFKGLAPSLVFTSSNEVLRFDAEKFVELCEAAGVSSELTIGEGLWHTWANEPNTDEGHRALEKIVARIEAL